MLCDVVNALHAAPALLEERSKQIMKANIIDGQAPGIDA